jgi:hypothetical protein
MDRCKPSREAVQTDGRKAILGPAGRMNAWCGLSIDTRNSTVWSAANGGHGDYFGNEVLRFDLMADNPAWVEWCPGSSGPVVDAVVVGTDPSKALYRDGYPCSKHSYYGQQFIERANRALLVGGSTAPIGSAFETVPGFDVSKRDQSGWDKPGTWGYCLGNANGGWTPAIGWACTKHALTEDVYVVNAPRVWRMTPRADGGTWVRMWPVHPDLNTGALGATAIDTKRGRLLWVNGFGPKVPYSLDLMNGMWTKHSSIAALEPMLCSLGMVYVPELDAYLVRGGANGGSVIRINAETITLDPLATTGGDGIPAALQLNPREENVFNRWLFAPALGGVVYFPRAEANAWFLRLA